MKRIAAAVVISVALAMPYYAAEPAKPLSNREVRRLIEHASNAEDHVRLAQHFSTKASRLEAEAVEHARMAKAYRSHPSASDVKRPMAPDTAQHCEYLAKSLHKAASEAGALASAHAAMAK
jgi:hypothetical protein